MPAVTDPSFHHEERVAADTLRVTRKSTFTGTVHTLDLPISELEWRRHLTGRDLIQDALPRLTDPEREFLLTGTTQAEWLAAFPPDEDEDDGGHWVGCADEWGEDEAAARWVAN